MAHALHSPDFYAGDPYPAYRDLRATEPVCWNTEHEFWALLKYEDIRFASTHPAVFSSAKGITVPDPAIENPVMDGSLIFSDPPRHRQLRKLINAGFTRRQVSVLQPKLRAFARSALDAIDPASGIGHRVRRADRRPVADPDDRRVARRPRCRLGAVPAVVRRHRRHGRP